MKHYNPDKTLSKILNEAAEEFKDVATPEQIKDVFLVYWDEVARCIEEDELPTINGLMFFGAFKPQINRIVRTVNNLERKASFISDLNAKRAVLTLANKYKESLTRLLHEKKLKKSRSNKKCQKKAAVN